MSADTAAKVDPITLEVLSNALPAIANEMSSDLQRSSYNMMIYEVRDYCCALLNAKGELLSQNIGGVAHFVADLGEVIRDGISRYGAEGFAPGDVLLHNHQRVGGQHLNNVCVYTPIFLGPRLLGFAAIRAHWVDVGGLSTGFGPVELMYDAWVEGLQFDHLKLWEAGELDKKLLRMISDNIRFPDSSMGDLRSQISACQLAGRRLVELYERYGTEVVESAVQKIFLQTEERCRHVVAGMPDGVYEAESFLDPVGGEAVEIRVRVTIKGSAMTIDFSGCSAQLRAPLNCRSKAGGYIAYKALTAPNDPLNEGSFGAVEVIIPEGNMMMATFPAPMAGWSLSLPTVAETVLLALSKAIPDKIPASHSANLGPALVFQGVDRQGQRFVTQGIEGGGWGGRPSEDGPSAVVSICQGDVRNAPIENLEIKCPLLVEARTLVPDSGGAGRFRGGLGLRVEARTLVEGRLTVMAGVRRTLPPWGLCGGKSGSISDWRMRLPDEKAFHGVNASTYVAPPGTTIQLLSAGGGGWGNPLEREPARVLADVIDGYITRDAARGEYGVVLASDEERVDEEATAQLRQRMRIARGGDNADLTA